jgi:hypothetical protein
MLLPCFAPMLRSRSEVLWDLLHGLKSVIVSDLLDIFRYQVAQC